MGQIKPNRLTPPAAKQPTKTSTNTGNWNELSSKFSKTRAFKNLDRSIAEGLAKLENSQAGFSSPRSISKDLKSTR